MIRWLLLRLNDLSILALGVMAISDKSLFFGVSLQQVRGTTLRATGGDGFLPKYKLAFGIGVTAVENFSTAGFFLHNLPLAAFWTLNACRLLFDVAAVGVVAASHKLTVSSVLES